MSVLNTIINNMMHSSGKEKALQLTDGCKRSDCGEAAITALDHVSLLRDTALVGSSGAGKSTLMNCVGSDSGTVVLGGVDISRLKEKQRTNFRRTHVNFIFHLLPALLVQDNITLPLRFAGVPLDRNWAAQIIKTVGLTDRLHHFPVVSNNG